jgi:hypothetical protein
MDRDHTSSSSLFAGRLVEPCLHIVLPVLLEMPVRDDIVVLHGAGIDGLITSIALLLASYSPARGRQPCTERIPASKGFALIDERASLG